jgi:hypothetical protein
MTRSAVALLPAAREIHPPLLGIVHNGGSRAWPARTPHHHRDSMTLLISGIIVGITREFNFFKGRNAVNEDQHKFNKAWVRIQQEEGATSSEQPRPRSSCNYSVLKLRLLFFFGVSILAKRPRTGECSSATQALISHS